MGDSVRNFGFHPLEQTQVPEINRTDSGLSNGTTAAGRARTEPGSIPDSFDDELESKASKVSKKRVTTVKVPPKRVLVRSDGTRLVMKPDESPAQTLARVTGESVAHEVDDLPKDDQKFRGLQSTDRRIEQSDISELEKKRSQFQKLKDDYSKVKWFTWGAGRQKLLEKHGLSEFKWDAAPDDKNPGKHTHTQALDNEIFKLSQAIVDKTNKLANKQEKVSQIFKDLNENRLADELSNLPAGIKKEEVLAQRVLRLEKKIKAVTAVVDAIPRESADVDHTDALEMAHQIKAELESAQERVRAVQEFNRLPDVIIAQNINIYEPGIETRIASLIQTLGKINTQNNRILEQQRRSLVSELEVRQNAGKGYC